MKNTKVILGLVSGAVLAMLILLALDIYNIRSENRETSELLAQADEAAQEEALIQSIRVLQNTAGEEIAEFEEGVLTEEGLVPVIESIEEAGAELGLDTEIVSVESAGEPAPGEPQKIEVVVEAEGQWPGAFSLLRAVESLPHRVMLESLSLAKSGTLWKAQATISLYIFE